MPQMPPQPGQAAQGPQFAVPLATAPAATDLAMPGGPAPNASAVPPVGMSAPQAAAPLAAPAVSPGPVASPAAASTGPVTAPQPVPPVAPPPVAPQQQGTQQQGAQQQAPQPLTAVAPPDAPAASPPAASPGEQGSSAGLTKSGALGKLSGGVRGRRAARKPRLSMSAVFADLVDMADIPRSAYAVDDEITGAMCLFKTDGGYEVFNCTEDARTEVRFFEEEESAYFYLFGVLAAEALRNGRLSPRRG